MRSSFATECSFLAIFQKIHKHDIGKKKKKTRQNLHLLWVLGLHTMGIILVANSLYKHDKLRLGTSIVFSICLD